VANITFCGPEVLFETCVAIKFVDREGPNDDDDASLWKYSKLSNGNISLNWSIIGEVTTSNYTTAYFFASLYRVL